MSSGFTVLKYDKSTVPVAQARQNLQSLPPVPGPLLQDFHIFLGSAYIRVYPLRVSTLGADSLDLLKCHIPYSANGKCKTHQPRSMTHWTTFRRLAFGPPARPLKPEI